MCKYYYIKSITLAKALNFLGFSYYVFDEKSEEKKYSFEDTEEFRNAYLELCKLKNKYKTIN